MKSLLDKLKRQGSMSADMKRKVIVAGSLITFIVVLAVVVSIGDTEKKSRTARKDRDDIARDVFTGADTRKMGLHGISTELKKLQQQINDLEKENDSLRKKTERDEASKEKAAQYEQKKLQQEAVVQALAEVDKLYGEKIQDLNQKLNDARSRIPEAGVETSNLTPKANGVDWEKEEEIISPVEGETKDVPGKEGAAIARGPVFRTIVDDSPAETIEEETLPPIFIPANTIISGVLLSGADMPTSDATKQDPYPMTLRIKKDAIMPNRFSADIRECGLLVSGYGELSSHRAIVRSEKISCVREDGGVIEVPLDAYATGEDGKLGIRGRLVDKRGQLLAKSLMAGFLNGAASVFNQVPVPTLNTSNSKTTPFQAVASAESAQSAAVQGTSDALERLADKYIEMADAIFPVLEIDAGRKVEFVVTSGVSLNVH